MMHYYWFDYLAGYDAVFAEFGWTNDEIRHISMQRSGKCAENKTVGSNNLFSLQTTLRQWQASSQMLEDLNMAYSAGAQYILSI